MSSDTDIPAYLPETCAQALANWDADLPVMSVAMSEVGPSHEQQIQIMAFECLRVILATGRVLDIKSMGDICAGTAEAMGFQNTPAQNALAINLASMVFQHGWRTAVRMAEKHRRIVVKRTFP